jgi:hypothetical protein
MIRVKRKTRKHSKRSKGRKHRGGDPNGFRNRRTLKVSHNGANINSVPTLTHA